MSARQQANLEHELTKLLDEFVAGGDTDESNAQLAEAMLNLILRCERARHHVVDDTLEAKALDITTLTTMREWDSDTPALLIVEKALKRLSSGRGTDALTLLERAITDRQKAASTEQRRRASTPRKKDSLTDLIEQIVRIKPAISCKELERALRREIGKGVIFGITDDKILLEEKPPVLLSGLKDRLTRAHKNIAKAG